jgi:hypothetical protein
MLYNLLERKSEGGKQFNRVELPYDLELLGWDSTNKLFQDGKIPKDVKTRFAYICYYEALDWTEEEQSIETDGMYLLNC